MNFTHLIVSAVLLVTGVLSVPTLRNERVHLQDHLTDPEPLADFDGAKDVTLYLYTQGNPLTPEIIKLDDDSSSPSFNPNNPTRVVIHGWTAKAKDLYGFRDAYIATGDDYNIVLVDWSGPGSDLWVVSVVKSAVQVGDYVGQVLNRLVAVRGLDLDNLVVIGHSMGGHIAGIVGNRVGGLAAEVVALDPANGVFDFNPLEDQLDISDAKYVQVIHTMGGNAGQLESKGHIDFFPNGGTKQVGCSIIAEMTACSHLRAIEYYVESITSNNFVATQCSSYEDYLQGACSANEHAVMGEWTPVRETGNFYLDTNTKSPFAQGQTDL